MTTPTTTISRLRRQHRRRGWRREVSFGCTSALLSIWEPTLPFLLLSSTPPRPSATAAASLQQLRDPTLAVLILHPLPCCISSLTLSFHPSVFFTPFMYLFRRLLAFFLFLSPTLPPFPVHRFPFDRLLSRSLPPFLILSFLFPCRTCAYSEERVSKGLVFLFLFFDHPPFFPHGKSLPPVGCDSFVRSFPLSSRRIPARRAPGVPVM